MNSPPRRAWSASAPSCAPPSEPGRRSCLLLAGLERVSRGCGCQCRQCCPGPARFRRRPTRAQTTPSAPWTRSQAHVPDGGEIRCAVVGAGQETVARVPRGAGGGSCQRRAAPRGAARPTGSRATGCHVRAGSLWAGWGLVGGVCSVLWCFGVVWAGLHCVLSVVSAIGPVADWVWGCVLWIWMWSSMSWLVPRAWLMGAGRRSPGWLWRPATAAPWVRRPWSVPRPRSPRCAPARPGGPRPGRGAWPTACGGRGPCWPRPTSGPPTAPAPWPL